jgi:hypothetical protein
MRCGLRRPRRRLTLCQSLGELRQSRTAVADPPRHGRLLPASVCSFPGEGSDNHPGPPRATGGIPLSAQRGSPVLAARERSVWAPDSDSCLGTRLNHRSRAPRRKPVHRWLVHTGHDGSLQGALPERPPRGRRYLRGRMPHSRRPLDALQILAEGDIGCDYGFRRRQSVTVLLRPMVAAPICCSSVP